MAFVVTDRGLVSLDTVSDSTAVLTSASHSPAGGSLLVAVTGGDFTSARTFICADTFTGTSAWTQTTATVGSVRVSIFTATAGASPGSGAITVTRSAGSVSQGWSANFLTVTGQATPYLGGTGSAANTTSGATMSLTISPPPSASSLVIGVAYDSNNNGAVTQPTSWTEVQDHAITTWGAQFEDAYINGSSVTSPQWSTFQTGAFGKAILAIEILAPSSAVFPSGNMRSAPRSRNIAALATRRGNTLMNWTQAAPAPPNWNSNALRMSVRRLVRPTRRPDTFVVPAQLNPPFPFTNLKRRNRNFVRWTDRPAPTTTPPQQNPPFQRNVNTQPRSRKFVRYVDRPSPSVVPAQQSAPVNPAFQQLALRQAGRKYVAARKRFAPGHIYGQTSPLTQRGSARPSVKFVGLRKGTIPSVVPPQFNPPFQQKALGQAGRKIAALRRHSYLSPALSQDIPLGNTKIPRRPVLVRKHSALIVVPAQQAAAVNPDFQRNNLMQVGRRVAFLKRRQVTNVVPAQQAAPVNPAFTTNFLVRAGRKMVFSRRGARPGLVPPQLNPPYPNKVLARPVRTLVARHTPSAVSTVPSQVKPPFPNFVVARPVRKVVSAGRRRSPVVIHSQATAPAVARRTVGRPHQVRHRSTGVVPAQIVVLPSKFVPSTRRNFRYALSAEAIRDRRPHIVYQHGVWRLKVWNAIQSKWISHPVKKYDTHTGTWILATNAKAFDPASAVWTGINPNP